MIGKVSYLIIVVFAFAICTQAQNANEGGVGGEHRPELPSRANQQAIAAINRHWTAEALRTAIPKTEILPGDGPSGGNERSDAKRATDEQAFFVEGGRALFNHEEDQLEIENPHNETKQHARLLGSYASNPSAHPWRLQGKVFFTQNGGNWVCSASIGHQYVLWTAGHCVYDMNNGGWSSNFIFIPAYNNGAEPYGRWYYAQLTTTWEWYSNRDFSRDLAAVHIWKRTFSGVSYGIGEYLGWHGYAWNYGYSGHTWTSLGYPAAYPFNGQRLYYTTSGLKTTDTWREPDTIGIWSDATGGCSGGPWLMDWNQAGGGYVNSVNSYGYGNQPNTMYGPYFDTYVTNWWNQAVNGKVL